MLWSITKKNSLKLHQPWRSENISQVMACYLLKYTFACANCHKTADFKCSSHKL